MKPKLAAPTRCAVQPDGDVTFMKRTFEGMSQWGCVYRWDGASFAGECSP